MSNYKEVPSGFSFNTEFDTWILAFCPDTLEWLLQTKDFSIMNIQWNLKTKQMRLIIL